jgi:hypothetical protein
MIFRIPALQDAEIANAVDAGILPEIDQQDMAAIAFDGVRDFFSSGARVDPNGIGGEIRRFLELCAARPCGECERNRNEQRAQGLAHHP